MLALIDADIWCYEFGSLKHPDENIPLAWPLVEDRLWERLHIILEDLETDLWKGYLTGKGNFREDIATIKTYKGNRKREERPFWYYAIYEFLKERLGCTVVDGYEADDAIAIEATSLRDECVICSKDKDLDQIPGWHYNWDNYGKKGKGLYYVSDWEAERNLYEQLLTGDSTDNILGLFGVGKSSSHVLGLKNCKTSQEMFAHVAERYKQRYGNWAMDAMMENLALLRLLRTQEEAKPWLELQKRKEASSKAASNIVLPPHFAG